MITGMKVSDVGCESKDTGSFNSETKGNSLLPKVDIYTRLHGTTPQKNK
jgi:hypothetical protein